MPVFTDNFQKQIELIEEVLKNNNEPTCPLLKDKFNDLAKLLNQQTFLSLEYFCSLEKIIKLFDEKNIAIPKELNKALFNYLLELEDYFDNSKEFTEAIYNCYEIIDALGEPAY